MKTITAVILSMSCASVFAAKPACYTHPATSAITCVDLAAMQIDGNSRSALIASGGPKGLTWTNQTMDTNCLTKMTHLRDRQGVSFAYGSNYSTPMLKSITVEMCDYVAKRKKP